MKMTVTSSAPALSGRLHSRKVLRLAGKRPGAHHHHHHHAHRAATAAALARTPPTDNSDDSGLGVHLRFDQHMDYRQLQYTDRSVWVDEVPDIKRRKLDLKVENEETNDGYCFPDTLKNCKENNTIIRTLPCTPIQNLVRNTNQNVNASKNINRCVPLSSRRQPVSGPVTLTTQLSATSRNGKIQLQIMCQPEQQHRARYQTEGSRGAVKDRTGNGFPIVKLSGYDKPATLQVFIGTDLGRVAPHMFYQACRVSGKNSTPCVEKKIDGTIVIEVELEPSKDMIATCDCVGILKERNVDVEHRFPEQLSPRSKKKSTKCRMVFRTTITNDDGTTETLQVCSQPIVCTQPPGIPEICKKSLTTSPASGGLELFILGKNFLKDTRVVFQQQSVFDSSERSEVIWEEMVTPDKEYLQQTHLVCVVPPYIRQDIQDPVAVRLFVISSGKNSEPHTFHYTPNSVGVSSPVPTAVSTAATSPVTVTGSSVLRAKIAGGLESVQAQYSQSLLPVLPTSSRVRRLSDSTKPASFRFLHHGCRKASRSGPRLADPLISLSVRLEANPTTAAPFLSKMLWQTGTPKQEMDLGMMPPPTSLVPLAQRRPSTNLNMESNSPPMRSLKTELIDENSQGSIVMENMINENSMDMRHRFRAISESSLDVHHDEANMTMINENSIEILRQQEIIKNQIDIMNENSNSVASSFHCEKSNASIHNDESVDSTEPRIFSQNSILPPHNLIENTTLSSNDLKGIDLRMKTPLATVNDLVNTQSPSLATLHRFVVTESTNMPLPTQTGQSVENYLTTIENNINKTIVSDSLANSNMKAANEEMMLQNIKTSTLLEGTPILSSQLATSSISSLNQLLPTETPGTNKLFTNEQVISNTLITTSANEILPSLTESHIKNNNNFEQQIINPGGPVIFSSQPTSTLLESSQQEVISQQNIQAAINANILQSAAAVSPKLDVLVNSRIESHIGSPIKSPQQEILIGNKSPLLPSSPQEILRRSPLIVSQNPDILITHTASQDVMINSQSPLLSSTITPNEIIIHSPQNDISVTAQISPNSLPPEVILNPQVSPSVMCRTQPDTLLQVNTICPQNILTTAEPTSNNLLALKNPPVSVESIVINAAVDDYLETQKKINEITRMDNHLLQNVEQQKSAQEQMINSLLDVRNNTTQEIITNNQAQVLLQNQVTDLLKLSQTQFVPNTNSQDILENNNKADMNLVKQISEQSVPSTQPQPELKKNEEGMIPPALTNMSENDLISYINPSCFDQDTKLQNMDVVPSNKIPPAETIRRSISTLNISYPNPGLKVRASISFTNGANNFGKQQLNEKTENNAADENSKENHVFYIWTKQINTLEPFMVFEEMLTYQGRKYSEADIATLWKKDCRMWLWKTKQRVISKKVNQKIDKIKKKLKNINFKVNKPKEELNFMDVLNCLQNLNLI